MGWKGLRVCIGSYLETGMGCIIRDEMRSAYLGMVKRRFESTCIGINTTIL
jgi:hypothetical protein